MKTTNRFLLTLTFFTVLLFILSSCSEPIEKTDPDTVNDPEKIESADSDPIREQPALTEIPFEGNLEAAYEAICNFKPLRFSMFFTELKFSVYRPSKITFEDLDPEYYLALAYDLIPEREREIIIEDAGIYSDSAYISGEYITEDIEYTVYTTDEVEKAVKTLFGEDVSLEHQKFHTTGPYSLVYDGKKYLGYDSNMDGDPCLTDYSVVLKAETDGEFVYITDKFASFDYDFIDGTVVSAIYSDGGQTNLLHSGDDIPYDYRTPNLYDYPPVNYLLWGDSLDFEVFGDLMQTYKHTFKLAEDGTYFWVSSEPITD